MGAGSKDAAAAVTDATTFIGELETKNQTQIDRIVQGYVAVIAKEAFTIADVVRVDLKLVIEATEIAALWVTECEDLQFKLALARQCGDGAQKFEQMWTRLGALGVDLGGYDPRNGGYSKLFAFLRSLQTTEERASAGQLTLKAVVIARAQALASWCAEQADAETARLYTEIIVPDERKHHEAGRRALVGCALNEESQARARRAAYRTLELLGEMQEPSVMRKIARAVRKTGS